MRKGAITLTVIVIFVLIVGAMMVMYKYSYNNFNLTTIQLKDTEAVYLAKAGLDMGMSAMFTKDFNGKTILNEYQEGKIKDPINHEARPGELSYLLGDDYKGKASLWIRHEMASKEDNKILSNTPEGEEPIKKFIKIAAFAVIGKDKAKIGDEISPGKDIRTSEMFVFINMDDPQEFLYVDPKESSIKLQSTNWTVGTLE